MLQNYIKVAWRNLKRNKVFSAINVFGLSIGLTACVLISMYIWHETHYDSYQPHADRLYQLGTTDYTAGKGQGYRFWGTPCTLAGIMKGIYPQIEGTARLEGLWGEDKTLIKAGDKAFNEEKGFLADSGFFRLFKYDFIEGAAESAISGPYSIVLSEEIAKKLFGSEAALNKRVHVTSATNGEYDYTVTGVFRPIKAPGHIDARFFISMYGGRTGEFIRTNTYTAANYSFLTYLLLRDKNDRRALEATFPKFVATYEGKDVSAAGFSREHFLLPVRDIHLHADMPYGDVTPTGSVTYLYILASIAVFMLLIACINFMNLSTARSMKRASEVGVRKVLGAGKGSLIRQYLGESLLMAVIAGVASIVLAYLLRPAFESMTGKPLYINGNELLILGVGLIVVTLGTGLLAGSYPALYLSSFQPVKVLKGKITNSLSVAAIRKGLVVFQFSLSILLIIASVIIQKQMHFMLNSDLGFDRDQQLIIPLRGSESPKLYTALKSEWLKNANVSDVAGAEFYPGGYRSGWDAAFYPANHPFKDARHTYLNYIDFDFMKSLNLKPVAGHIFTNDLPADSVDGVVVNEASAKQLGYTPETIVGKQINQLKPEGGGGDLLRVVGVVKDFHYESFHRGIDPMAFEVFSSFDHFAYAIVHLRHAGDAQQTINALQKTWKAEDPGEPFEYHFLDEQYQELYESDTRLSETVGWLTGIAICISCLGLFGLATFSAEQRRKEIGIRKVLGASTTSLVTLLSGDFLKLVTLSIVVGSPLAWWVMHRWLQDFAYRTDVSWPVFALTAVLALTIAAATVSFQAIRSAIANPIDSLRTE